MEMARPQLFPTGVALLRVAGKKIWGSRGSLNCPSLMLLPFFLWPSGGAWHLDVFLAVRGEASHCHLGGRGLRGLPASG